MNTLRMVFVGMIFAFAAIPGAAANLDAKLTRMLTGKNEATRMQAVAILQNDPERIVTHLSELIDVAKAEADKTAATEMARPSIVDLLNLIGSIRRPESEQLLTDLLNAPHVGIAMVATETLGRNGFTGAIKAMKRQIYRPEYQMSYGFRFNLVRSLALMKHLDAIECLDEMRPQFDGQLRYEIDKLLAAVTAADFPDESERFVAWQKAKESKIMLTSGGSESESRERMNLGRAQQYYGIDIHAKRMMFILDNSGSMKECDEAGVSRLYRAKYELVRVIDQLPKEAEFSILVYSNDVHLWHKELVVASDENKRDAYGFIERVGFGMHTNTYGALRQSLEYDSDLEAVYLLTDGRPTVGDIVAPPAIVADIMHRNRFRHLNFNTIGVALDGMTDQFMRTLAELSGGEFRKAG